jgi:putative ABC transport system ATP-binding protein
VIGLLRELADDGATLVVITHEHGIAASFERQIQMQDGEIVADSGR